MILRTRTRHAFQNSTNRVLILFCVLTMIPSRLSAQTSLNLDFEESWGGQPPLPRVWRLIQSNNNVALDEDVFYSGRRSLRIARIDTGGHSATFLQLPINLVADTKVRFSGYIRTNNVRSRFAGLWFRVDDNDSQQIAFDDMPVRAPRGTTDWNHYAVELDVPSEAGYAVLGCYLEGDGTAWFDSLGISVNGVSLEELIRAEFDDPTVEQIAWVRDNAIPFVTPDAGSGFTDLEPLEEIIGDAGIVALGEGTHGTSEFFRMKHRLVEFLAEEMGFTVFAIEANMPECEALNRYVLTGTGDPRKGLDDIYFWTWNTREVLDMIEWMREFNASGRGRMEFWGFDMQAPLVTITEVNQFLTKVDPDYAVTAEEKYGEVAEIYRNTLQRGQRVLSDEDEERYIRLTEDVLAHLEENRERYCRQHDSKDVNWGIQKAQVIRQSAEPRHRDRSMADNVDWILAHHPPGTRIVLWAHNGHIHEQLPSMGGYLAQRHDEDYYSMGFCFETGDYTAVGPNGLATYTAGPPASGSVELVFQRTGLPRFILDLHIIEASSTTSGWLHSRRLFRSIGSAAIDNPFYPVVLCQEYDALIWIARTTNSVLLHPPSR